MLHTLLECHTLDHLKEEGGGALHFKKNGLCGVFICICVCKFHITILSPRRISKIPSLLKHMRAFKRLNAQTIHFIIASKSQRTPPKDRGLFDNVYNRHPKSSWSPPDVERQDGARAKPPQAEWGQVQDQVSGSSKLQKGNKDSDIPVGSYETGHQRRRWEENHSSPTVKGTQSLKPNGTMV